MCKYGHSPPLVILLLYTASIPVWIYKQWFHSLQIPCHHHLCYFAQHQLATPPLSILLQVHQVQNHFLKQLRNVMWFLPNIVPPCVVTSCSPQPHPPQPSDLMCGLDTLSYPIGKLPISSTSNVWVQVLMKHSKCFNILPNMHEDPPSGWQDDNIDPILILYDLVQFYWCTSLGKSSGTWIFHLSLVTYIYLDMLQSPAYIGSNVKVQFTLNAESLSKAALNSTRYSPFQLINYPQHCIFPAQPVILRKCTRHNGKGSGNGVSLQETLVFKLAQAFVVGSKDKDGNLRHLAFMAHKYCTSISGNLFFYSPITIQIIISAKLEWQRKQEATIVASIDGKPILKSTVADPKGKKKAEGGP